MNPWNALKFSDDLPEDYFYGIPLHAMSMNGQLLIRETLKILQEIVTSREFTWWGVKSTLGWTPISKCQFLISVTCGNFQKWFHGLHSRHMVIREPSQHKDTVLQYKDFLYLQHSRIFITEITIPRETVFILRHGFGVSECFVLILFHKLYFLLFCPSVNIPCFVSTGRMALFSGV